MVTDVKTWLSSRRSATARLVAVGLIAALASAGWSGVARAENELERLWGDTWGHPKKPAPLPTAPVPATNAPAATAPASPAQQAPQPAPVTQAAPAQPSAPTIPVVLPRVQTVSDTLDVTGNAAAVNQVKLIARVVGFLDQIHFEDGPLVKKGDLLFTIQQDQYKAQLQQAQAQLQAATGAR